MSLSFGLCALLYATADKTEREGYMEWSSSFVSIADGRDDACSLALRVMAR
jgi:hypothetical protein